MIDDDKRMKAALDGLLPPSVDLAKFADKVKESLGTDFVPEGVAIVGGEPYLTFRALADLAKRGGAPEWVVQMMAERFTAAAVQNYELRTEVRNLKRRIEELTGDGKTE